MTKTSAVVFGGSGLIGRYLLDQLADDGTYERVTAIHRRTFEVPDQVELKVIDLDKLEQLDSLLNDQVVFVALGTTLAKAGSRSQFREVDYDLVLAIAEAAQQHGAAQLHIVSAIGANPQAKVFYNRVKGEMEVAVEQLKLPVCYVYQPSILDGPRQERRIGERFGLAAFKLLDPFLRGPLRPYRAIHATQVAAFMIRQSKQPSPGFHRIDSLTMRSATSA